MGYYIDSSGNRTELEDKEKIFLNKKDIVELNIDDHINLKVLYCSNNQLTELDISKNINLEYLNYDIKTNIINIKQFLNNKNISINQSQ